MWPVFIALLCVFTPTAYTQESCRTPFGTPGSCINLKKCDYLINALRNRPQSEKIRNFLRDSFCGYEGNKPKVCCISKLSDDYRGIVTSRFGPLKPPECGLSNVTLPRLVGGQPAMLGAWPWMTALGYNSGNPKRPNWKCGGCLISKQHVLTAAHCILNTLYVVRIGDLDLENKYDGAQPFQDRIQYVVKHPDYNEESLTNDIAVLRIYHRVPFTSVLHPICLPVQSEIINRNLDNSHAMVAGWGTIYRQGPQSTQLLQIQVPISTQQKCRQAYPYSAIDARVVCAGSGGKSTCKGDSGGPLMVPSSINHKYFYVIGVISKAYKCGEPGYPTIYTKVTSFLNFVTQSME